MRKLALYACMFLCLCSPAQAEQVTKEQLILTTREAWTTIEQAIQDGRLTAHEGIDHSLGFGFVIGTLFRVDPTMLDLVQAHETLGCVITHLAAHRVVMPQTTITLFDWLETKLSQKQYAKTETEMSSIKKCTA